MRPALLALSLAATLLGAGCASFHADPPPGAPADATFAEVDGVALRVLDAGPRDAPAVVLIHGYAASLDTWLGLVPVLATRYRVIALDLKGFGWSGRPEGDYSPPAEARLVLGLMDQLGVEKARVVAHSWGSSVALALALAAPERVERLALYGAWIYYEELPPFFRWAETAGVGEALFTAFYDERPDERMARAFYDPALINEAFVERYEASLARPGTTAAALAAARGQAALLDMAPRYRTVTQPTLLMWGREDRVSPVAFGERLVKDLPRARLVVYPRCGHFPMVEAAAASTRELLAFLAEAPVKPGAASLLAALALAGAALATVPARATGFEELGGELGDRVDRHVLWNGTFRLRGALFSNLDLDRGPTPSGQLLFPVPLSDPNAQTLTHADMRLRSDLTFVAPNGGIAVKLRLDVLDGVTLGSAPDGPPSAATGQSPGSAAIAIKRAWAETLTPFGVLAAGRMGSGWGLGILTNGGDCFDCDSGDAADRVAFATPLLGLIWAVALDFTAIGPTTERRGGTHAVDLDPADDVWTFTFALLRYHDARAHTRRKAAGKLTFDAGAYLSHRWQDKDVPAEYTPVAVDVPLTQRQVVTRGFTATAVDAWVRVTHPDFEVEAEGVVLFGGYDQATLVPGALLRDEVTASQWGFALESRFGDGARGLSGGLNVGAASGDPAYGFGVQQPLGSSAPARGDLDGPQASLPGDARFDNLRFHPDYRVDQILFREILGTITDAAYLRPHGRVVVTDFLAGELVMDLALVASMALEKTSTPGQAQALGVELDPSVSYRSEDGFRVDLDYAVLFPLAGLDNPDLGLGAKPAQLWRLRLGYLF